MSILQLDLPDARVLDLFAGSGALGLEALSRGAASAEFVELSPRSLATLEENIALLDAAGETRVHRDDAMRFINRLEAGQFDVAFVDPPYRVGLADKVAEAWKVVPFARVIGIEHEKSIELSGGDRRVYGDTVVTFFRSV